MKRVSLVITCALVALWAIGFGGTAEATDCAKCMNYNICEFQPDGYYTSCFSWPCSYSGTKCSKPEVLFVPDGDVREMRLGETEFVTLYRLDDEHFANWSCSDGITVVAREMEDG